MIRYSILVVVVLSLALAWALFGAEKNQPITVGELPLRFNILQKKDKPGKKAIIIPQRGDPLYVLHKWAVAKPDGKDDKLAILFNFSPYGQHPDEAEILPIVLIFPDPKMAEYPFAKLTEALRDLELRLEKEKRNKR